jgi:hypothetical protein
MHYTTLPLTDQIFTHLDDKTAEQTVFASSAIRRHCEATHHPISLTPIEPAAARMIFARRGIERPRLLRAVQTGNHLPLLYLTQADGTNLLVDGSHTYIARFYRGNTWATAYVVPRTTWANFTVEGIPSIAEADLLASHSGISL